MNDYLGMIAAGVVILAVIGIVALKIYKHYRSTGKSMTLEEFMDTYTDQIVSVLKDVIDLIKLDQSTFETREDYEYTVISTAIDKLIENSTELGIELDILNMFSRSALADIVYKVLHNKLFDAFEASVSQVNICSTGDESFAEGI